MFSNMISGPSLTPCFSWVFGSHDAQNRFNGLLRRVETVETVSTFTRSHITQLKQGVNETAFERPRRRHEISGLKQGVNETFLKRRRHACEISEAMPATLAILLA